eukprot:gene3576-6311_t
MQNIKTLIFMLTLFVVCSSEHYVNKQYDTYDCRNVKSVRFTHTLTNKCHPSSVPNLYEKYQFKDEKLKFRSRCTDSDCKNCQREGPVGLHCQNSNVRHYSRLSFVGEPPKIEKSGFEFEIFQDKECKISTGLFVGYSDKICYRMSSSTSIEVYFDSEKKMAVQKIFFRPNCEGSPARQSNFAVGACSIEGSSGNSRFVILRKK